MAAGAAISCFQSPASPPVPSPVIRNGSSRVAYPGPFAISNREFRISMELNFHALNKKSASNRHKSYIFLTRSASAEQFQLPTSSLQHPESNRGSQKLKSPITPFSPSKLVDLIAVASQGQHNLPSPSLTSPRACLPFVGRVTRTHFKTLRKVIIKQAIWKKAS